MGDHFCTGASKTFRLVESMVQAERRKLIDKQGTKLGLRSNKDKETFPKSLNRCNELVASEWLD